MLDQMNVPLVGWNGKSLLRCFKLSTLLMTSARKGSNEGSLLRCSRSNCNRVEVNYSQSHLLSMLNEMGSNFSPTFGEMERLTT